MLTQQELLVSELMSITLSILGSKDDRLKKVGVASCGVDQLAAIIIGRLKSFVIHCRQRKTCSILNVQSDCPLTPL